MNNNMLLIINKQIKALDLENNHRQKIFKQTLCAKINFIPKAQTSTFELFINYYALSSICIIAKMKNTYILSTSWKLLF